MQTTVTTKQVIGVIMAVTGGVAVLLYSLTAETPAAPGEISIPAVKRTYNTGTTTEEIDPFFLYVYKSSRRGQGACIILQNASGNGYTYLTAENGVLKASAAGCGE